MVKILIQKFYELIHNIWLFIIIQRENLNATKVKVWIYSSNSYLLIGNCFTFECTFEIKIKLIKICLSKISFQGNLWILIYISALWTHFTLLLFELFVRKNLKHISWRTKKIISCLVYYSMFFFQLKSCCILSQSLDHASYFLYLHTRDFLLSWEIICPLHVLC